MNIAQAIERSDFFVLREFGASFQQLLPTPDKPACTRLVHETAQKMVLLGHEHRDALGLIFQIAVMVRNEAEVSMVRASARVTS